MPLQGETKPQRPMKLITVFEYDYFTHVSVGPRLLNDANKLGPHWKSKGNSYGDSEC